RLRAAIFGVAAGVARATGGQDAESYFRPRLLAGQPRQEGPGRARQAGHAALVAAQRGAARPHPEEQGRGPTQARNVPASFGESWKQHLSGEFGKPYLVKLMDFVAEERKHHKVYPHPEQVFTWTQMCDIRDVKVVILGQDPYHRPNQAHGLCFSVQRPVPPPPSLENIFKELSTDIDGFVHPGHGDLSGWARQGVLLLNAVLTFRAHQASSHKERGWEQFTDVVVSWLNQNLTGLVFLLWGSYAQKKGSAIDRKRHHVLQTAHPPHCRCIEDSLDVDIFLKPMNCSRSLARGPSTGRSCDLSAGHLSPIVALRCCD
ncbi:Uracil-DNA glycosylase, partial [Lemmus lemmus]